MHCYSRCACFSFRESTTCGPRLPTGENEGKVREADLRKAFLAKEEEATEEMKRISEETLQNARDEFAAAQSRFGEAADSMPGGTLSFANQKRCSPSRRLGWELFGLGALDALSIRALLYFPKRWAFTLSSECRERPYSRDVQIRETFVCSLELNSNSKRACSI